MANKQPDIHLPVWMNKGEPLTLAHASKTWWGRVYDWLTFPLAQIDVDTCDEQLLDLLAYQRDITRFPGESLSLYRLRVKHAFVNSQDAGSVAGFERIFARLEIGKIQQLERQLQYDWDVIVIRINDEQLSRGNDLMMRLVRQYGRTCRRYFFDVLNHTTVYTHAGHFDCLTTYDRAKLELRPTAIIPDKTELWLLPGEEKTVSVQVLPEGVDDASFTATVSHPHYVTLTHEGNMITVKGVDFGQTNITLETTVGGQTATIQVRVVAGAKVDMLLTSYLQPIFYSNVGDADIDNIWLDWGDGELIQDYRIATGEGGSPIYPIEPREINKMYTLTIYNGDEVTFSRQGVLAWENRVIKLHQVSGLRTSLRYFLYDQRELTDVAEKAFDNLPHASDISSLLEGCSALTVLPETFLVGKEVSIAERAFRLCGLTKLPRGFLQQASQLSNASSMFSYCPFEELEEGLFLACSETLENMANIFMSCKQLTSDLNLIFNATSYPVLKNASSAFYLNAKLTGQGLVFIDKCPALISHARMFQGCSALSDYSDIPSGWK